VTKGLPLAALERRQRGLARDRLDTGMRVSYRRRRRRQHVRPASSTPRRLYAAAFSSFVTKPAESTRGGPWAYRQTGYKGSHQNISNR